MRIIALIIVVAIVCLVYGRNGGQQSPQARVTEAQQEAAQVQPEPAAAKSVAAGGSLRAPIDRTRQVLELVKTRNKE